MSESDWSCIERHLNGDAEAMSELVDRYRQPLMAFIFSRTRQQQESDDIFQETWFKVLSKLGQYRPDNFPGWLLRIARNLIVDRVRRHRPETSLDEDRANGSMLQSLVDSRQLDAHAHLERREFSAALRKAVARLPDDQRDVFVLRVQGEVPFKTIAKAQGVSINTALARMQYALEKLRRELAEYQEDGGIS